eukprot:TRINITY_DN5200_c0_g1_i1.p1 TRINITY_DN5200_c0_g1~~TRINITY_DN5200_c0_g1_i1.p1  ORF type:complete len:236 (-),score=39.05 TRINITY_DN5200_c0_g1_i1:204-911(-)
MEQSAFANHPSPTFYDVLGVKKGSSNAEIRSAYKKLAKKWHPDKWSSNPSARDEAKSKFQQIQEAYSVLSDGSRRALYDAGVYSAEDEADGFSDFLDEMAVLMVNARKQNNGVETWEELRNAFEKMVSENCYSTTENEENFDFPGNTSEERICQGSRLCTADDFLYDEQDVEEWWWDSSFYSDAIHSPSEKYEYETLENESQKRQKLCHCSNIGSFRPCGSSLSPMTSVSSTAFV